MVSGAVVVNLTTPNARRGAVFDGVDDFVDCNFEDMPNTEFTNGFTLSCWIKVKSAGESNEGRIFDKSDGGFGSNGFAWYMTTTDKLVLRNNIGNISSSQDFIFTTHVWYHIAISINSSDLATHYINGAVSGTPATIAGFLAAITSTNNTRIGNLNGATTRTLDGIISDLKVHNRAVSQEEITALAADKTIANGLIHNWKFSEDYKDSVGTADGTNTGTRLTSQDDQVMGAISGARVTASDKYMIANSGDDILSVVIEEAP